MFEQIRSVMTCLANSGADHRDNGRPLSAAGRQASALTCATLHRGERRWPAGPFRIAQTGQARRCRHRRRHLAAVSTQIDKMSAIAVLGRPCAASNTIDIGKARRCVVVPTRASRESSALWVGVNWI